MAYTDEAVKAKLSALNETQESIVTVAQWVMFHRRHADRTAQLWLQRLKEAGSPKRLNLIYLANEVIQQTKAKRKEEFLNAFAPIIAEATMIACKGATKDVQQKLQRVIEVWRQRQIFELPIQDAIEARVEELVKSGGIGGKKSLLGGSLFSSSSSVSAPPEIQPLVSLQSALAKASVLSKDAVANANVEYNKMTDPNNAIPTPPVHAARLSALLKSLASAEGAVAESIKARRALIDGLEKLLDTNRTALASEETEQFEVTTRKSNIEAKKREVEDGIMRGLSHEGTPILGNGSPGDYPGTEPDGEPERPYVEELTPPPVESLTPTGSPPPASFPPVSTTTGADIIQEQQPMHNEPPPSFPPPLAPAVGSDLLASFALPQPRPSSGSPILESTAKRRKLDQEDDFSGFGGENALDGLDADVAELLRQESGGN